MTEEEIQDLHERLAYLVDTYGAEVSLIALAGYASARSGRHYEVVELPPLTGAEKAEIETLASPETFQ
jgi:hypothetical protein